jgi:hypothetical protein
MSGFHILGKITKRILSGEIPPDSLSSKRLPVDNTPSSKAVRRARGQGLGNGATRKRSGPGATTGES